MNGSEGAMDDGNDKYEKDETLTVIRARKCESEED